MDTHAHDHHASAQGHAAAYDGSGLSDAPAEDARRLDEAEPVRDGAREAPASEGAAGGLFFEEVAKALRDAEAMSYEAGRQTLGRTYEDLRVKAVGNIEIMLAHAQLAAAALKWDSENLAVISDYLAQVDRCLSEARNAVLARMQLVELDAAARAAREAPSA